MTLTKINNKYIYIHLTIQSYSKQIVKNRNHRLIIQWKLKLDERIFSGTLRFWGL